jgi:transposase-like protein
MMRSDSEADNSPDGSANAKGRELTNEMRNSIVQAILESAKDGSIPYGVFSTMAKRFGVCRHTVYRVWKRAESCKQSGVDAYVSLSKSGLRGRKKIDYKLQIDRLKAIPPTKRGTVRATAAALGIPKSSFFNMKKRNEVRVHTSSLKPLLTAENMVQRVEFCKTFIQQPTMRFVDMYDMVHIDEKWFYVTTNNRRIFLHPDEEDPVRVTKSKRFITKVMFLCAVARPRFCFATNKKWNGKVGIWPIVEQSPAVRSSRNRTAGTLVTKPIEVNKEVYRGLLVEKVLPAIKKLWPPNYSGKIRIQQDNARPHINNDDAELQYAIKRTKLDIELTYQPPNSPDLNVLDLGYFNSIQALQQQQQSTTIEDLIESVEESFRNLHLNKLDNVFLTLQTVMDQVILHDGSNNYRIPHMNKEKLQREGRLPVSISCSEALVTKLTNENIFM